MSAPVEATCPLIDGIIKDMDNCLLFVAERYDGDDWRDIADYLSGVEEKLEELRRANGLLRTWCAGLEDDNEELRNIIADRDDDVERLEQRIVDLEGEIELMSDSYQEVSI